MPTILVIDDDPHMGLLLTRILSRHGFEVQVAMDGASGIEKALVNCPDLVLLDIIMPGMDGIEVAGRLRAEPSCADLPIVFLTAFASAVGRHEAAAAQVNGFISKPFIVEDVVQRVKELTAAGNGELGK